MTWTQRLVTLDQAAQRYGVVPDPAAGVGDDWLAIVCTDPQGTVAWASYAPPDVDPQSRCAAGSTLVDNR